jgi:hypothetical protein
VLLDFIHRLVSQKIEELKIYTKYHNTNINNDTTPLCDFYGRVYCDIFSIFLIPQFFETPDDG